MAASRDPHADDDNDSDDDNMAYRILAPPSSAAPPVSDALLAAVPRDILTAPIDPSKRNLQFNPTYDQLWTPVVGPAHPHNADGRALGLRNHRLGSVQDAAVDSFVFDEQYHTFQAYGYSVDPASVNGTEVVGKKEEPKAELTEEQKKYAEEHALKKAKKERGDKEEVEEKSTFHGKQEKDYQGRSWIAPPKDVLNPVPPTHCYIPKRWIHTWSGHTKGVSAIRFFPKYGHLLLSASMDTKIKIWDVPNTQKCMRTYMGHSKAVRDICFANDGLKFVSCAYDRNIKLWDTETGQVTGTFSTGKIPYVVKLHPDDDKQNILLAGMSDKKIMQWDTRSGEITQEYDQHLGAVNTITFLDDNRRFVTSSDDKSLRVWEFGIPVVVKYISEPHMHSMPAIAVHPNKAWVAAQSLDNQIIVYGAKDRFRLNRKKRFAGHIIAGYACQVNFSPDGRFIMSGDGEGKLWFWDWKTCKVFRTVKCHDSVCIGCEWHPLETSKVATCGWDGLIKYWD
ncbi:unnamed protein product [Closterium sp. Yama58-4]|nr:unnamed protein product [Closterium sp. Yama58-4]